MPAAETLERILEAAARGNESDRRPAPGRCRRRNARRSLLLTQLAATPSRTRLEVGLSDTPLARAINDLARARVLAAVEQRMAEAS
jgi:hypothetical protein